MATTSTRRYYVRAMAQIDPDEAYQKLATHYATMGDGELEKVAIDFAALTKIARDALRSEMAKRTLAAPEEIAANHAKEIAYAEARKPVVLRRYRDLPEALVAKGVLESAGIDCLLADDNMVRLDWFYSNLVGGIKLLVPETDIDVAAKLLDERTPQKFDIAGVGEYEQPDCPRCGSMDITLDGLNKSLSRGARYASSGPIPVASNAWKCLSCGQQWNDESEIQAPLD